MSGTDLTFFTNEKGSTLLNRFNALLRDTEYFDVLVGYFRASGFHQLYKALEPLEKIRILVGLNLDRESYDILQKRKESMYFESHKESKEIYQKNLIDEIENNSENESELEKGVRVFIKLLTTECEVIKKNEKMDEKRFGNGKKMEIKVYPNKNLHAKVYIGRFKETDKDYGFVVTGSSNFSESGLVANREFNVELRKKADVEYAEEQFEALWEEAVDVSDDFIETITQKTWLNDEILPYHLYLKLIYEYLEEDINLEDQFEPFLPNGFMELKYQKQAAVQAKKILETYNGVFLADVVGLGKTFITALLLQQLQGRTLVICPPVLKNYWHDTLSDFGIRGFDIESLGKLEYIIRKNIDKYDYIVVDEAHRFRNEDTQAFANLQNICRGKKVILVTATPLNNNIDDILAQLKFFQYPRKSTIPGIPNLDKYFSKLRTKLSKLNKDAPEYKKLIKEVSNDIRNNILRYVMVRRTRKDVITHFLQDIKQQGLNFPEVSDPKKIVYEYKGELEEIFMQTILKLKEFTYARYTPLLYHKDESIKEFDKQQEINIRGFMKGILVKRLESSFYAFKQSVDRFIDSYQKFIEMYKNGTIYISKKVDVYELIDNDNIEKLENLVGYDKAKKYNSDDFNPKFEENLKLDLEILISIKKMWENVESDPKLDRFISELKNSKELIENKIVIFTESKETGDYLYQALQKEYGQKVMFYSSAGVLHSYDKPTQENKNAREKIAENFDPKYHNPKDDIKILISTDVLSEGVNLHRSNILINYDLPWNPVRVLQRSGRVNRLGSKFNIIHIFNFFPTTQSDKQLGLEKNIVNKIQMFHDILGEDAKYLSDEEETGSRELFDKLNSKNAYIGEEEQEDSELKYLEFIREIRDKKPDLFDKIKKLPKKARSGFKKENIENNLFITFFRVGKLKKFYIIENNKPKEITFFDAVKTIECTPETKRTNAPKDYFDLLKINRDKFDQDITNIEEPMQKSSGSSNLEYIEKRLKTNHFRLFKGFTSIDQEFIENVKQMLRYGAIAKKTAKNIKNELEKTVEPLQILTILRKFIHNTKIEETQNSQDNQKREVILSGYLVK